MRFCYFASEDVNSFRNILKPEILSKNVEKRYYFVWNDNSFASLLLCVDCFMSCNCVDRYPSLLLFCVIV